MGQWAEMLMPSSFGRLYPLDRTSSADVGLIATFYVVQSARPIHLPNAACAQADLERSRPDDGSVLLLAWFMTAFPHVQSECREMATVRIFRCGNGQAVRLPKEFHLKVKISFHGRIVVAERPLRLTSPDDQISPNRVARSR